MENLERQSAMKYNVLILYFYGLWHHEDEVRNWKSHFLHWFPYIQIFRSIYTFVIQLLNVYLVWGDINLITEHFLAVVMSFVLGIKLTNILINRKQIREMINKMIVLQNMNSCHLAHNVEVLDTADLRCKVVTKYFGIEYVWGTAICALAVMIHGYPTKTIPFRRWLPYDYSTSPIYEVTSVTIAVLTVLDCFIEFASGSLLIAFIVHTHSQLKILRYNLENIRDIILKRSDYGARECALDVVGLQLSAICTVNMDLPAMSRSICTENMELPSTSRSICTENMELPSTSRSICDGDMELPGTSSSSKIHAAGTIQDQSFTLAGLVRARRIGRAKLKIERDKELSEERRGVNHEMERLLTKCAIHHQTLIKLTREINEVFKTPLALQLMVTMSMGAIGLYITTLVESLVDGKVVAAGSILLCLFIELMIFCVFADLMTVESVLINDAAYACDWLDASEGFKRSIRIIMNRSQRPLYIKAAGIPLSRRTFRAVCKSAYYLHMLLSKLYFGEKFITQSPENT